MDQIEQFIRDFNDIWIKGKLDDMFEFIDKRVVMLTPTKEVIRGAETLVDSYRQFLSAATIHDFQITKIETFCFTDIAICHMDFAVDYELASGRFEEAGLEIYTIDLSGKSPKIIWRSQMANV